MPDVLLNKKKINLNGTVSTEVPLLYALTQEIQPIINEFLVELNHIEKCDIPSGKCSFPWCGNMKKLIAHSSICTDMECKECIMIRPLLLLHSISCSNSNCTLPFCSVLLSLPLHPSNIAMPGVFS